MMHEAEYGQVCESQRAYTPGREKVAAVKSSVAVAVTMMTIMVTPVRMPCIVDGR